MTSDREETHVHKVREKVPLAGEQLDAAIKEMETPRFLEELTARIMKLARKKGFHSPFEDQMDLPGGKSASDLANDILEKVLDGSFNWDDKRFSSFKDFCISRAESILSNWLTRNEKMKSFSPILEIVDSGELASNPLNTAVNPTDIYTLLRSRDADSLGDKFLQDFSLSLPDQSHEQRIALAVFDDRECGNRSCCLAKLQTSEADYDAAVKRLIRRLPSFRDQWLKENRIGVEDWKEAR